MKKKESETRWRKKKGAREGGKKEKKGAKLGAVHVLPISPINGLVTGHLLVKLFACSSRKRKNVCYELRARSRYAVQRVSHSRRSATMFAVFLFCVLRETLCLTPATGCAHMDDHRACRVTSVHTLSTSTERTENNKCSAVACVDGQAQTLLLTRVSVPPPWRLSTLPTQRTLGSVGSTLSKQFRTHPSRSTSAVAMPGPSPGIDMFGSPHEHMHLD